MYNLELIDGSIIKNCIILNMKDSEFKDRFNDELNYNLEACNNLMTFNINILDIKKYNKI